MPLSPDENQILDRVQPNRRYGVWLILMMGYMLIIGFFSLDAFLHGKLTDTLTHLFSSETRASTDLSGPIGIAYVYPYSVLARAYFKLIIFIIVLITLFNFWKRKKAAPKLMIAFFALWIIYAIIELISVKNSISYHSLYFHSAKEKGAYMILFMYCLFFLPSILYLIRSKRVKVIFTH